MLIRLTLLLLLAGCGSSPATPADATPTDARPPTPGDAAPEDATAGPPPRFLALGDSYTIGEGVTPGDRWPAQLVGLLRSAGRRVGDPAYIARTGWTTPDLDAALDRAAPRGPYGLVTLLIGVNDQFRGAPMEAYRPRFEAMLGRAVGLAGAPCGVVVLSIPDYSVTPFGQRMEPERVRRELDAYNEINREVSAAAGVAWVDVTAISRRAATEPELLAPDGLHPSGRMYAEWAGLAQDVAAAALACGRPPAP